MHLTRSITASKLHHFLLHPYTAMHVTPSNRKARSNKRLSMSTRSIDPASSLLSPPDPKVSSANPVHAFFTPRRNPLRNLTPSGSNSRGRGLPSPEASPSNRCKRQRLGKSLFGSNEEAEFVKPVVDDHEMEEEQLEPVLPTLPKKIRTTMHHRLLMRSLGGLGMSSRNVGYDRFHCADWGVEVMGFHSRPEDLHTVYTSDSRPSLPFTVQACNRNSLIAIGDESGSVRLIESAKDESPGFEKTYLGMNCHDNAVFDISFSPDDYQMATASGDQSVRVFDVQKQICTSVLQGHRSSIKQIVFNPLNPSVLTSCSRDGSINMWDLRCVGVRSEDLIIHKPVNSIVQAHTSPVTRGKGGQKRVDISVTAVTWIEEFKIASASELNAEIKVWDIRFTQSKRKSAQAVESSALPPHHKLPNHRPFGLNSLTMSPDGARLYSLCRDSVVYVYDTQHLSNGPIHAYTHPRLHASTFYVKSAISRDGRLLSTGSSDGCPIIFPTDERYLDKMLYPRIHPEDSRASQIGKLMAVGSGAALVRGYEKEVTDVTWTERGDMVAISDDYLARCWRAGEKGEEAESMRDGGEDEGRRWGWGWAELEQSSKE